MAANPTTDFLEELGRQGHLEVFEQIKGRLRLDLTEGQETVSWLVVVDEGDVGVSSGKQDADCVVHAERTYFDRVVTGQANALAGLLRGVIEIEGNLQLALVLGRALPGPSHSRWRGHRRSRSGGGCQQ
jgi:putative sterol carrier protein